MMKNNFNKIMYEYEELKASENLRNKVNNMIKREKICSRIKVITTIAVVVVVGFTSVVNLNSNVAFAMKDIPVLGQITRILTFGRYEFNNDNYYAKVVTPKIEGLLDKDLENKINEEFKENSKKIIANFEKDMYDLNSQYSDAHMGVDYDYVIRTDNQDILAIDVYLLNVVGSSSTKHSFYTMDKKTGELLSLKGLFKDGGDFVTPISKYIKTEIKRLNDEENGLFFEETGPFKGFEKISETQNFFINDVGNLVICFDKYDIAVGAQGSPEFEIPKSVIEHILK